MKVAIASNNKKSADVLRKILARIDTMEIIWQVSTTSETIELCEKNSPDMLFLDLSTDGKNCAETTCKIMETNGCGIIITKKHEDEKPRIIFDTLGCGAIDVLDIPDTSFGIDAEKIFKKIRKLMLLVKRDMKGIPVKAPISVRSFKIVAIGASTGGPKAISTVLQKLPSEINSAIIIAQHVDAQFASGFSQWLGESSNIPVEIAMHGKKICQGKAYVAIGPNHLTVNEQMKFEYVHSNEHDYYVPSIDILFFSLCRLKSQQGIAALLTGMGNDGAEGLLELRKAGWMTLAQDKSTSVVYGMPGYAAKINAAKEILPIEKIADSINNFAKKI